MPMNAPSNKVEWDVLHRLEVDGRVLSVAFSPDSRLLASASAYFPPQEAVRHTNAVIVWDVASGKELHRIGNLETYATWVSFSPDGQLLGWGSADYTLHLLELSSGKEVACLKGYGGYEYSACFSPDGRILASALGLCQVDYSLMGIALWEIPSGRMLKRLDEGEFHRGVAFSPDGRLLASGLNIGCGKPECRGDVILWELSSGQQLRRLEGHKHWIVQVCFSPDGKLLASASWDGTVRIWDVPSGRELITLGGHESTVFCIAFSPDGKTLVSGDRLKMLRVWDVSSGSELQRLTEHHDIVFSVSFSPDGQLLASGALELPSAILIWKAEPIIEWLMDDFRQKGKVDAGLLEESVRRCREKGRLRELADALKENGFFEEAAKIYDDVGQAPTKSKSESTQRPKESKPSSREAASTKSVCPSCGAEVKANWLECPECGASLKEIACQNCGEPLEPHWKRCPACRTDVAQSK